MQQKKGTKKDKRKKSTSLLFKWSSLKCLPQGWPRRRRIPGEVRVPVGPAARAHHSSPYPRPARNYGAAPDNHWLGSDHPKARYMHVYSKIMAVLLLAIIYVGIAFEALDCMLQRSLKSYGQREKKETTTWIFLYKVVISSLRRTKN